LGFLVALDEVCQRVRIKLLAAAEGARPKIADYQGRGDLRTFLSVVVVREAINLRQEGTRQAPHEEGAHAPVTEAWAEADPELLYLRRTYEEQFHRVFREAVASLVSGERTLLRFHYIDRLNIDEIGAILGIHRVTASRRLNKVRATLVDATRRLLAERLVVDSKDLESILRLLESQVDISLRRVLGEGPTPPAAEEER
jgi:RNA polymerase sigma-70 factor (ECF subfamily)